MKISDFICRGMILIALSVCFAGCDKEKVVYVDVEGEAGNGNSNGADDVIKGDGNLVYLTISASNEINDAKSRTQIGSDDKIYWQKGDKISVFYANGSLKHTSFTTQADNALLADFTGLVEAGYEGQYLALYPYNETAEVVNDNPGTQEVTIKSSVGTKQVLPPNGGYDPKAYPSVAVLNKVGESYKGTFRLLCGLIGFKFVEKGEQLKSPLKTITIRLADQSSQGHFHLSGDYSVVINENVQIMEFANSGTHEINVVTDGDQGFKVDGETEYLISVPPIVNDAINLEFIFSLEDGRKYTIKKCITVGRAMIKPVKVNLSDGKFTAPLTLAIDTKEEFTAWYNSADVNQYDMVTLDADIEFDQNETFATRKFAGVFDGGGHTIKNMTVTQSADYYLGFIGELSGGCVKNLTLDNFTATDEGEEGKFPAVCAGFVAYMKNGAVVSNCKIINSKITSSVSGGISGKADKSEIVACEVSNCEIDAGTTSGGLAGQLLADNKVVASYAHGSLYGQTRGGIVGIVSKSDNNSIISCYSTMKIERSQETNCGIFGQYGGYGKLVINKSFYAGPITTIEDRITPDGLKGKMQEMNSAITEAGYDYQYIAATEDAEKLPLVITAKAE